MNYATENQFWLIKKLALEIGFDGKWDALNGYGINYGQQINTKLASEVIEWLKSGEAARYLAATKIAS